MKNKEREEETSRYVDYFAEGLRGSNDARVFVLAMAQCAFRCIEDTQGVDKAIVIFEQILSQARARQDLKTEQ